MSSTTQIFRADLEQGSHGCEVSAEISINLSDAKDRECRICHMSLESDNHVYGVPIELGCSCKDDLAAAHKLCAETWFGRRGKRTCEICHSVARNVFATKEETTENLRDNTTQLQTIPRSWPDRHFLGICIFSIFFITFIIASVFLGLFG